MNLARPSGLICPIATPLNDDETLDVQAYQQLIDRIINNVDGILVLGTTGEFALLRDEVAAHTVQVTIERANGRKPVYVGIGDTGTKRVLEKLQFINGTGADYGLVTSPYYYSVNDEDALAQHFLTVADAATVPILIYNIPQHTHVNLPPKLVGRLANHPNIVGLKDSWGDFFQFQEFLKLKKDGFSVFMGPEQLAAASLWLGADGIVSALSNFVPDLLQRLVSAVNAGDQLKARATQQAITNLASLFQYGSVSSALKVVLSELGICSDRVASPLPPCTPEQKETIRHILQKENLIN
ncbi:MAG TPA: dihydrodipicolinate synthase family protein [candidate division Zixibacteria bacterium]|nr:dihydrodipicolinate synthase family protein [candidate division Zixibacteria bacterium]